jgi:hypothetical protein
LDFICKGLESAVLVGSGSGPVFFKLNDWLETEGSGSDLQLDDPNKIGGGGFCEVNDNQLWSDRGVGLLTNSFSKKEASETLF